MDNNAPPPDRIPGTAVSSNPPTTTETVDAPVARGARAQEPYRFDETMGRSTTADQMTAHGANAAQNQPTHGETGGEATDLKTPVGSLYSSPRQSRTCRNVKVGLLQSVMPGNAAHLCPIIQVCTSHMMTQ